jgi:hypothetical protein
MRVVTWQDWQASRARLNTAFTDSPQDFDAATQPEPNDSLWVVPYFAGRVPMEAVRNYIYSGETADNSGPAPDLFLNQPSYTGRTNWQGVKYNARAVRAFTLANVEEGGTGPDIVLPTGYNPTFHPRRR